MSNFMGKDGFNWFVGVVEDRADPKTLGRLRVRALGYHTEDLIKLPTEDLPWAHVMNPITSATVSGVGQTPLGAVEGTWVVGFFQDGQAGQQPVIIGTLPGVPGALPVKIEKGDDDKYPGKGFQDYINANYPKYTETDVNRLAVNDEDNPHSTLTIRKADRDEAVGVAQIDGVFGGVAPIPIDLDDSASVVAGRIVGGTWSEPETSYNSSYPYNHVRETESGHIRELDDTVGAERIHERHTSGSGYEIGPDGSKVTRVKKDNYTIITNDDYAHIQGNSRLTIDEGLRVRVNSSATAGNNYNIEVGQGSNVNIEVNGGNINLTTLGTGEDAGDVNVNAARDLNIQVNRNFNVAVLGNADETISGKKDEIVAGNNTKTGKRIDLN
jgi:hypothetical protein